jgi:hypothetical protein
MKVDHAAILPCIDLLFSQERCDCMNLGGSRAQVNGIGTARAKVMTTHATTGDQPKRRFAAASVMST